MAERKPAKKSFTAEERAAMKERAKAERAMATRLHAIIQASAKVVCFFQSAQKFKSRYATFGFSDAADLDAGAMWPTSFALKELTAAEEARIGALVKKAVG